MQLSRLEGFYWVAKTGGYSRAARAFPYPITQPGVYQQVKKLETDLAVALFERVARDRVILTAAGQTLFEFVGPFFERLPAVLSAVTDGQHGGRLRIHAAGQVLRRLMPQWLLRVRRHRPDIDIDLIEVGNAEIDSLTRGDCDLLVDYVPEIPAGVQSRSVGLVRAFVVVPAGHPAAQRRRLRLEHLRDQPFVAYEPGRRHRDLQLRGLAEAGVRPERILSASSSDTILALVEAGLGYSLVPSFERNGPRRRGVVSRQLTPRTEFPISAVWRSSEPSNPLIDAVLGLAPTS